MATHTISVNNIAVYAHHGCWDEEAIIGGEYSVDVEMITDFTEAADTDMLSGTIDYVVVKEIVYREMAIRSKLIEHVAQRIVHSLKKEIASIQRVIVRVTKYNAPMGGQVESVSVEIED
jgi:dihydroneopterin aldolase